MFRLGHRFIEEEEGSISLLVVGFFAILLATSLVLTDITAIYLAKRSLTQITESGVQRGMMNLDKESYYSGEYNLSQLASNLFGGSEVDPGIPINCGAGAHDAGEAIARGNDFQSPMGRANLTDIRVTDFECDGFQIYIETSAIAKLPIPIPFLKIGEIEISSHAGAIGERAGNNNYSGFDIG